MMNLSCRRASELLSQQQDRPLSVGEWTALKAHLAVCRACRTVSDQFKLMRRALQQLLEEK